MARYTGPACKLCRREGEKLFLKGERCFTPKCAMEKRAYPQENTDVTADDGVVIGNPIILCSSVPSRKPSAFTAFTNANSVAILVMLKTHRSDRFEPASDP